MAEEKQKKVRGEDVKEEKEKKRKGKRRKEKKIKGVSFKVYGVGV